MSHNKYNRREITGPRRFIRFCHSLRRMGLCFPFGVNNLRFRNSIRLSVSNSAYLYLLLESCNNVIIKIGALLRVCCSLYRITGNSMHFFDHVTGLELRSKFNLNIHYTKLRSLWDKKKFIFIVFYNFFYDIKLTSIRGNNFFNSFRMKYQILFDIKYIETIPQTSHVIKINQNEN